MSFLNTYNCGISLRTMSSSQIQRIHIFDSFPSLVLYVQSQHMRPSLLVPFSLPLGREFGIVVPGKCKFFKWIVAHKKCWTADRLAKKGFSHPAACPLCDQAVETIDHLLVSRVLSRQVWFNVLRNLALQVLEPHAGERSFEDWWASTSSRVLGQVQKGFNSIVILRSQTL